MGCTSSSANYRGVYEELLHIVGLSPEDTRLSQSSLKAIRSRSNTFAIIGNDLDPVSGSPRVVSDEERPFLEEPKPVEVAALVQFAKTTWGLSRVHPLAVYLAHETVSALSGIAAETSTAEGEGADRLPRTLYRPWLLSICEVYHVLAVFEEQRGIPKAVQKWLRKVEKAKDANNVEAFAENGPIATNLRALTFDAAKMKPTTLEQLAKEFPDAMPSRTPSAEEVLAVAQSFTASRRGGRKGEGGNPLQPSTTGSGRPLFFSLVGAVAIRQALALRGVEEDAASYAKASHPLAALPEEEHPAEPPAADVQQCVPAESLPPCPASPSSTTSFSSASAEKEPQQPRKPLTLSHLLEWGALLRRHEEICAQLREPTNAACTANLERERDAIDEELQGLFDAMRKGTLSLGRAQAAEGLWDTFNLQDVFISTAADDHVHLSDLAFDEGAAGATVLSSVGQFRRYLGLYVQLYRMYSAARTAQCRATSDVAGVEPLASAEVGRVLAMLPENQQRQVVLVADPSAEFPCDGDGSSERDDGEAASAADSFHPVFALLAELDPTDPTTDGRVPFGVLCGFVARAITRANTAVALRDLAELRATLGLDLAESEAQIQSVKFVSLCCATPPETADAGTKSHFVSAASRRARLAQFSPAPSIVALLATHFCAAASTFPQDAPAATEAAKRRGADEWVSQMQRLVCGEASATGEAAFRLSFFFAHALFTAAAALRCLAEARAAVIPLPLSGEAGQPCAGSGSHAPGDAEASTRSDLHIGNVNSCSPPPLCPDTQVSRKWFCEATHRLAAVHGCPASHLLDDAGSILGRRPANVPVSQTARTVGHNSTDLPLALRRERTAEGEAADVAALDRAFGELSAVDHTIGMHGGTVLLEDWVYVCLFNTTKDLFAQDTHFRVFFDSPLPFNTTDAIASFLAVLPLHDERLRFRDFFLFSGGARAVPFDLDSETNPMLGRFTHAMYTHYEAHLSSVAGGEEGFARWVRDGVLHLKGKKGELIARDYAAVLEHLFAEFVAFTKHKGSKEAAACALPKPARVAHLAATAPSTSDDAPSEARHIGRDAVRRKFVEELLLFPRDEGAADAATRERAAETAKRVFTELQLSEMDERNGDVSLDSVAAWYGTYRVAAMPDERRSELERWLLAASRIPYSSSFEHRRSRRTIAQELRERQEEAGAEGHDATMGADGYIGATVLAATCLSICPRESISLMPSCSDAEAWLRACIQRTNSIARRADLGDGALHEQDLRFFFAFMHRDMTVFCALRETEREIDAASALVRDGRLGAAACESAAAALRSSLERCLWEELDASPGCIDELLRDDCLARFYQEGRLDAEGLAHHIATAIVSHEHDVFLRAQQEHQEEREAQVIELHEREILLGRSPPEIQTHSGHDRKTKSSSMSAGPIATYWERLRFLLPHGDSLRQRALRGRLWSRVDIRGKGYVTLADLNRGLRDVLRLQEFREDVAPVLFRAFFATTEVYAAESDVIYLTRDNEQYLVPRQFRTFLAYLYSYMELYFMFDVLTCSGCVDLGKCVPRAAPGSYPTSAPTAVEQGIAVNADGTRLEGGNGEVGVTLSSGDALFEAACSPFFIMKASSTVQKHVTLPQFRAAWRLLRYWGAHVSDTEKAFRNINRRAKETGEMYFTGFAIWASEANLHPEGYAYGFTEDADEVAELEARLALA